MDQLLEQVQLDPPRRPAVVSIGVAIALLSLLITGCGGNARLSVTKRLDLAVPFRSRCTLRLEGVPHTASTGGPLAVPGPSGVLICSYNSFRLASEGSGGGNEADRLLTAIDALPTRGTTNCVDASSGSLTLLWLQYRRQDRSLPVVVIPCSIASQFASRIYAGKKGEVVSRIIREVSTGPKS